MKKDVKTTETSIEMTYEFGAKVERVFEAWKNPELLKQWMGPGPVSCLNATTDFNVGGSYEIHMKSPEGDHYAYGEYLEIKDNEKIKMTWQWREGTFTGSELTVLFFPTSDGTRVELRHDLLPNKDRTEKHTEGWIGCLDKLGQFLQQ